MSFLSRMYSSLSRQSLLPNYNNLSHAINGNAAAVNLLHTSSECYAEPIKRKKRIDPAVLEHRKERRMRRIERELRRFQRMGRFLKPIEEREVARDLVADGEVERRSRAVDDIRLQEAEVERRALLEKSYAKSRYAVLQHEFETHQRAERLQTKALAELKQLDPALYQAALEKPEDLLPFSVRCKFILVL